MPRSNDNLPRSLPTDDADQGQVFDGELLARTAPAHSLRTFQPTLTGVDHDLAAAQQFLSEYDASPNTRRRYETEITRLFYWAAHHGKAVSALTRQDYQVFEAFLTLPEPEAVWCGPRVARTDPAWRPFAPLARDSAGRALPRAPASVHAGLNVIQSMLSYWVDDGYLRGNPLKLKRLKRTHGGASGVEAAVTEAEAGFFERFFDTDARAAIEATLAALPAQTVRDQAQAVRLRWLYQLLSATGCRIGELAAATQGDLRRLEEGWWLRVLGKGRKPRQVPVPPAVMTALGELRAFHGLPRQPAATDTLPLLVPLYWFGGRDHAPGVDPPRPGITPRQVLNLLKALFDQAARRLEAVSADQAARLRQGSAHWFRHTYATRALDEEVNVKSILDSLGHADERILRRYHRRQRQERHRDMLDVFGDQKEE